MARYAATTTSDRVPAVLHKVTDGEAAEAGVGRVVKFFWMNSRRTGSFLVNAKHGRMATVWDAIVNLARSGVQRQRKERREGSRSIAAKTEDKRAARARPFCHPVRSSGVLVVGRSGSIDGRDQPLGRDQGRGRVAMDGELQGAQPKPAAQSNKTSNVIGRDFHLEQKRASRSCFQRHRRSSEAVGEDIGKLIGIE